LIVILANAGIHCLEAKMDPHVRGDDVEKT